MTIFRSVVSGAGALSLVLLLSGCSALSWVGLGEDEPAPARSAGTDNGAAVATTGDSPLRPGDRVLVSSWREQGLSDTLSVDESGSIVLPLLGRRTVTDRPADELKAELVEEYESKFRNHTVDLTLFRRVSVLGAVQQPGIYYVDPTMTVADAVALAGGPADDGKEEEVFLQRSGSDEKIPVSRQTRLRAHARSGDQIVVPKRNWFSRNSLYLVGTAVTATTIVLTRVVF